MEGASALLGLDGTLDGERCRARFFSRNACRARDDHRRRVRDGRRAGAGRARRAGAPSAVHARAGPGAQARRRRRSTCPASCPRRTRTGWGCGRRSWSTRASATARAGRPLHLELVRRLRRAGAPGPRCCAGHGATAARTRRPATAWSPSGAAGRWSPCWSTARGRCGAGGRCWTRSRAARGWSTGEIVPAFRATAPGAVVGGLRLAAAEGIADWTGPTAGGASA